MVHVPLARPLIDTKYVTLLPGLLVPVTEMLLEEIAVPLDVAVTEDALRSPSEEVTLTLATDVAEATEMVPNVGAEVSTKTWYDGVTVVFPALSVVLN